MNPGLDMIAKARFRIVTLAGLFVLLGHAMAAAETRRFWQDPAYWTAPAKPLDIAITLGSGDDDEASKAIGPEGGTLALATKDGTRYELVIPPKALLRRTTVSMRAIAGSDKFPGKPRHRGGVAFEPAGLRFARDATLRITPKDPLPKTDIPLLWGFDGDGQDAHLTPFKIDGASYVRPVDHFSGIAFNSVPAAARNSFEFTDIFTRDEAKRLRHALGVENVACARSGGTNCGGLEDAQKKLLDWVGKNRVGQMIRTLGRADATCDEAKKVLQEALEITRWAVMLGYDSPALDTGIVVEAGGVKETVRLLARAAQLCRKKAAEECRSHGNTGRLVVDLVAIWRDLVLYGETDGTESKATRLALIECIDKLVAQCFARGDAFPLLAVGEVLASTPGDTNNVWTKDEWKKLDDAQKRIVEALRRCARYKLVWVSETRVSTWSPCFRSDQYTSRARFEVILTFHDGDGNPLLTGEIRGEGTSRYEASIVNIIPTKPGVGCVTGMRVVGAPKITGSFAAKIWSMDFNAGKPQALVLLGSEPRVEVPVETIQNGSRVGNEFFRLMSLAFQLSGSWQLIDGEALVKNLRPRGHPLLFEGTARTTGVDPAQKAPNGVYVDVSEITLEHIGTR